MITRKTKIVCSIGPASDSDEIVRRLILTGMNIARFNFSHGTYVWHKSAMDRVKRISAELKIPVAVMLDTKGPEIRTGMTKDGKIIEISAGDRFEVTPDESECFGVFNGNPGHVSLSWKKAAERIVPGNKILIADGLIEFDVDAVSGPVILCTARNSGEIGSRKNVNIIGVHAGLPIMSEQDKSDIAFGVEQDVDFIAASFVSFPEEVVQIREYLTELGSKARIISKIENEEGLDNIDHIIDESDGIMVARGDLGVQVATERIPLAQKSIISKCRKAGKPVITATQMLDSMIVNPRPTRAELTDVANAVFDGTDAVMLSGETAGGKYPVESVETMARIVTTAEESEEYKKRMMETDRAYETGSDIGRLVARNAFMLASDIKAKALITPTLRGNTARMISSFRPEQIVIAVTPDEQIVRQLMLNWGVHPMLCSFTNDSEEMVQKSIKTALDEKAVSLSDSIVMVAGIPLHSPLMANTIRVILVGNVLARGTCYGCADADSPQTGGRIVRADDPSDAVNHVNNMKSPVLLCWRITESYIPVLRLVNGVIAEFGSDLSDETLQKINKKLVWITDAPDALRDLEEGLSVTIDGSRGLVYEGIL
jgi:pyruvate kinase